MSKQHEEVGATGEAAPVIASLDLEAEARPPTVWRTIFATLEGRLGLVLCLLMLVLIVAGPWLAPYPPNKIGLGQAQAPPSAKHLLGLDQLGRDVLSRFLNGGQAVILVPLLANLLAFGVGGWLGLVGAYRRDFVDTIIARAFDLVLAVPSIMIALVLIAGLGTSRLALIFAVGLVWVPRVGRVVRGAAQGVVANEYVQAAQARGERTLWILTREVLPNAVAPIMAAFALYLTYGVIFVASLNFLGLGDQPPAANWGLMVGEYKTFIMVNPWPTLVPAFAIGVLSVAFTLVADAITRHAIRTTDHGGDV